MNFGLVVSVVVSLFCLAGASLSESCDYVYNGVYLEDVSKVNDCFTTFQVEQGLMDQIITNLEVIQDIYPYVDIAKNPPKNLQRRVAVDYDEKLEDLKKEFDKSNRVISKVFRATNKFIASFHDGHFGMSVFHNMSLNVFADVTAELPFVWEYLPDDTGAFHVYVKPKIPNIFLSESALFYIQSEYDDGNYVVKIDDKDPIDFLSNLFGDYDPMKSIQGSYAFTQHLSVAGFPILIYPDEKFFTKHVLKYADHVNLDFYFGFTNQVNSPVLRDAESRPKDLRTFVTLDEELKVLNRHKSEKSKNIRSPLTAPSLAIQCDSTGDVNVIRVSTFGEDMNVFQSKLVSCVSAFDKNDKPIVIYLPMNGGGYVALEMLLFHLLMPNADHRGLVAVRKTETNEQLVMDVGFGTTFADIDQYCYDYDYYSKNYNKIWRKFETDDLGHGVTHERTKKYYFAFREYLEERTKYALKNNIRKPTDIVVVTDGFCFSACSFFVDTVQSTGSGIVAGIGPIIDNDVLFQASQCASSVIEPDMFFEDLEDNGHYGLEFTTTFLESYPLSEDMKETIPNDYQVYRIDKHMEYYNLLSVNESEVFKHAKLVHEEFQTHCNSDNHRLFMVSENCTVDDPHALTAGYACGTDGLWNHSDCRISTCTAGYSVDFDNNECVKDICDPRYDPSADSSAMVRPLWGFISLFLYAFFCFIL